MLTLQFTPAAAAPAATVRISKRSVLAAVVRRSGPHLIEATVIPAVLFYVSLVSAGVVVALLAALAWSYGAVLRRLLFRRAIPPILMLAVVGITVRTLVAAASGSSFVYFLQPIFGTLAMGAVFMVSLVVGRPLVERLAFEFCPLAPDVIARPAVARLFRGLTVLWAAVNLATAATTFTLLLWLPLATFVAAKTVSGLVITCAAIALTVSWSFRIAGREDLVPSLTQDGPMALVPARAAA